MHVYDRYRYTGHEQRWTVPQGVTQVLFECWGAAGGMSSDLSHVGKTEQVVGGKGPANNAFTNNPHGTAQLGQSFANAAGYAAGIRTVTEGDVFYIYVGGNGGPGHSSIKQKKNGGIEIKVSGGEGGWNGGGQGGDGAHTFQNLFNNASTQVHYKQSAMPNSAKQGQLWWDTSGTDTAKKCNTTYAAGGGTAAKWDTVTNTHPDLVGPSGGGGGGATDIRQGGNALSNRILIAGGGGGSVGPWVRTGKAAWTLHSVPDTPVPPFGTDNLASGATGPDSTWATDVNFFQGGWGGGGMGGGSGPRPNVIPSISLGFGTNGDAGGPATDRHKDGNAAQPVHGSGGKGGGPLAGGTKGSGGLNGQNGSLGQGGNGADAKGGSDDFCAGGGGGGGGLYGGGGGGHGFKVTGDNSDVRTRGGGGGGGSNYADNIFTAYALYAGATPPFAKGNSGTGANGRGGFCRVSYRLPPAVVWVDPLNTTLAASTFGLAFTYKPAKTNGPGIAYYQVGTATSTSATFPTSIATLMVADETQTDFSYNSFTAPAAGVSNAYFVQVVDTDGDASGWLKQIVTGISSSATTAATITSPASGATFTGSATVNWTVGTQTPLAAYRLGVLGNDLATGKAVSEIQQWQRGNSRVNLAGDPGFALSATWSSTSNSSLVGGDTSFPGVSGKNGKITWTGVQDGSAEQHTTMWNNLLPGQTYRMHLGVSSALANDPRPVELQVWDNLGILDSQAVDLSAVAAGTYVYTDLVFTPRAQGVYFSLVPSAAGYGAQAYQETFEGAGSGSVGAWAATAGFAVSADATNTYQGGFALKMTGAGSGGATATITTQLTALGLGAGWYVASAWVYVPAANDRNAQISVTGAGITGGGGVVSSAVRNQMVYLSVPFSWNGVGTVTFNGFGALTTSASVWMDLPTVSAIDQNANPAFGRADSGQIHYLADMLLELVYAEDSAGYGTYFDGGHLNGNTGAVSWSGTTNASASVLTGTDVTTDTVTYSGTVLTSGQIILDTLTTTALIFGYAGPRATKSVKVNPSTPATPTVTLTVNSTGGVMSLAINASDGAFTNKTVSFDIFRGTTRIATGLAPDVSTRLATFIDVPAHGETATYTVRAFDSAGGYTDQTTGTVVLA